MDTFDELTDETPTQDLGREIGAAVGAAVVEAESIRASRDAVLVKAIADALHAVESKRIEVLPPPAAPQAEPPKTVRKWAFHVKRDRLNLIETITAEAID